MNEPIIEFRDESQAYECLKEWQTRLFLTDWLIKISIVDELPLERCGQVTRNNMAKTAEIELIRYDKYDNAACLCKHSQECSIIHELLHLKLDLVSFENPSFEQVCFDDAQHQLIEQMAKSIIMAKYNLPFEWFKNF